MTGSLRKAGEGRVLVESAKVICNLRRESRKSSRMRMRSECSESCRLGRCGRCWIGDFPAKHQHSKRVQYNTTLHDAIQYSRHYAVQCQTMQYNVTPYNTVLCNAMQSSPTRCDIGHDNTTLHTASPAARWMSSSKSTQSSSSPSSSTSTTSSVDIWTT